MRGAPTDACLPAAPESPAWTVGPPRAPPPAYGARGRRRGPGWRGSRESGDGGGARCAAAVGEGAGVAEGTGPRRRRDPGRWRLGLQWSPTGPGSAPKPSVSSAFLRTGRRPGRLLPPPPRDGARPTPRRARARGRRGSEPGVPGPAQAGLTAPPRRPPSPPSALTPPRRGCRGRLLSRRRRRTGRTGRTGRGGWGRGRSAPGAPMDLRAGPGVTQVLYDSLSRRAFLDPYLWVGVWGPHGTKVNSRGKVGCAGGK